MASSHGVPRVEREGDVEKEKVQIQEYRALIDNVNAKVRDRPLHLGFDSTTTNFLDL